MVGYAKLSDGDEINQSHKFPYILETKSDPPPHSTKPHPKLLSKEDSNKILPKRVKENGHQYRVDFNGFRTHDLVGAEPMRSSQGHEAISSIQRRFSKFKVTVTSLQIPAHQQAGSM